FYVVTGSLSANRKLRRRHYASIAGRLRHNDACPTQSIWRLAFQPKGHLDTASTHSNSANRPVGQMAPANDPPRRREFGRRSGEKGNGSGRYDLSVGV